MADDNDIEFFDIDIVRFGTGILRIVDKSIVEKTGRGPGTTYVLK